MKISVSVRDEKVPHVPDQEIWAIEERVLSYLKETDFSSVMDEAVSLEIVVAPDLEKYKEETLNSLSNSLYYTTSVSRMYDRTRDKLNAFYIKCAGLRKVTGEVILLRLALGDQPSGRDGNPSRSSAGNGEKEDESGSASFMATDPVFRLERVIMPDDTRRQIERAMALIRNQKKIYEEWGFSEVDPNTKTILCFYGAPGTGKTMCAHALAAELGKKILIASYASIESKWVGEGPKNLRRIFQDAAQQDAVLFFDEADSFLSKRAESADSSSDKHYNRMSNEMFQLLEDYNGIVIFATNLVKDFDKAFKSRILAFVEFRLPDFDTRKQLLSIMIPSRLPLTNGSLTDEELSSLSKLTEGFSGRELRKGMLTTLAEGALSGREQFGVTDFEVGFDSVKKDTQRIEKELGETSSSEPTPIPNDTLAKVLEYSEQNDAIVALCLLASRPDDQDRSIDALNALKQVASRFETGIPSGETRSVQEIAQTVKGSGREKECMRLCCEVLAGNKNGDAFNEKFIRTLGSALEVDTTESYMNYLHLLKSL